MSDLTTIDTSRARLPSSYHAAKKAISQCVSIDECKDWSDKAAALASYAVQAKDDQLEKMAKRIRARATRRAGEILKQVESAQGARSDLGTVPTRSAAAAEAGMSERQAKTAQRLASVPEDKFEEMVEGDATVTEIAAAGTQRKEIDRRAAKALLANLKHYVSRIGGVDISEAVAGLTEPQAAEVRMLVARIDGIHDRIVTGI